MNNPDVSTLVMFRARFRSLFPGVPDLSCQEMEEGIITEDPSQEVEEYIARLLSLALNRKKPVE